MQADRHVVGLNADHKRGRLRQRGARDYAGIKGLVKIEID